MDLLPLAPDTPHFRAALDRYVEIHDEPRESVRDRVLTHTTRQGYRGFVAREEGYVVGYAYGHDSSIGHSYHDRLRATLPDDVYDRWLTDAFELVELGVIADARRRGIATELHDKLLPTGDRTTAILTAEADNDAARAFYDQHDWWPIYEPFHVVDTPMTVFARNL